MSSVKQFSVEEAFDYQGLLQEAIETIRDADVLLGRAQKRGEASLQKVQSLQTATGALLKLKQATASFAPTLTVQRLDERFERLRVKPSAEVSEWMRTHHFYLVQVPVTLMPPSGWAFTRLECWVGFEAKGCQPKVHDIYPEDAWSQVLQARLELRLGIDEELKFRASAERLNAACKALSAEAQAKLKVEVQSGTHLLAGPFQYSVSRPTVMGRGLENSEVFWRLDGKAHVQCEEPYLAVVLRVPKEAEPLTAAGELRAYQNFDFLGANLSDWAGHFRQKVLTFFNRGLPLETKTTWRNIAV